MLSWSAFASSSTTLPAPCTPPSVQVEAKPVRTGQLDLCLLRPPRIVDPALNVETIWLEPLVALLPPKHPLADNQRVSLERLKSEPWIIGNREQGSRYFDEVIAACAAAWLRAALYAANHANSDDDQHGREWNGRGARADDGGATGLGRRGLSSASAARR